MKHKNEIKKELEELAPRLSKMGKRNSFKVPEGYFAEMNKKVMEQIKPAPVAAKPVVQGPSFLDQIIESIGSLFQPRLVVAMATVALLVATVFFLDVGTESSSPTFASLTDEEVSLYLAENIGDFEEELLSELDRETFTEDVKPESADSKELELLLEQYDDLELSDLEELL